MKKKVSCFCISGSKIREKDIENVKDIMKTVVRGYLRYIKTKEVIVGYEDIPVYVEQHNIMKDSGATIRLYYVE